MKITFICLIKLGFNVHNSPYHLHKLIRLHVLLYKHVTCARRLPVDWLHLSGDAYYCSWRKPVKFVEKVPDVGPVLQVQVKLNYLHKT